MSLALLKRPEFSVQGMTEAINNRPNKYGLLNQDKLFDEKPLNITTAEVEFKNGVISLVPSSPRGSAPTSNITGKRTVRMYKIPRYALTDDVIADDVQNVRSFGNSNQLQSVQEVILDRQEEIGDKIDITEEFARIGAIKGDVLDADGTTLVNWFTEFDVTEKVVINFGSDDPIAKSNEVKRHIEENLTGDIMTHVRAYCSATAWDGLMANADFKDAYKYFEATKGRNPLRDDLRTGFFFQGIEWVEYIGTAPFTQPDGSQVITKFIPEGEMRFVPVGTRQTFKGFYAPADYEETVNTRALLRYSKQWPSEDGRKRTIEVQTNVLFACLRPGVLVRGKIGA